MKGNLKNKNKRKNLVKRKARRALKIDMIVGEKRAISESKV